MPWATPGESAGNQSNEQPTHSDSPAAHSIPANQVPAAREEGEESSEGEAKADAEAADTDSSVALWQAAVVDQQRGAHAAPAPTGAAAFGGHGISKWLLGAAVAAGGMLAAVGVAKGVSSNPPAVTAKERPEPILAPGKGLDEEGSPTPTPTRAPTPTPTPTKSAKSRLAAGAGRAVGPPVVALANSHAQRDHVPAPAHTPAVSPQRAENKSMVARQGDYLAVRTALKSPNDRWSQSEITVTTTKKLTALKVVLHVAQTGGVTNTGVWTSLGDKVTVHTGRASDGGANYVIVLNEGITLDPGTYVFQFGYNHDTGTRDTFHDIWGVVTTAAGDRNEVYKNGRY
ncbi:hypothetical protein [Streptomyces chartreusis]|uniref:hypothetical protein n=1 Tax=Streptomyces chartreusis TaxID=1969 RepID=UPI001C3F4EC0|nr:hypothetical protein [Streptomyces chartreusis]